MGAMSQVNLTLRPPPNVDFVIGYPGIPPGGPDRPQALVKGAIEVRVGQQGVKAKWVRIELRKVETLPGGGMPNTFYDFVGPSPVNLWTSSDEYTVLRTQDFPFAIRIPESIPPSIALENRAGIQYELVASVCTKGKKGFFRKRKSTVHSTQAAIIIDKHDLHSTWPVYNQHESRNISHEGINMTVDRNQTCYGPGDRVSVMVTVKSDSLNALILRGYDISLRETTVFKAGHYSKKNAVPPPRTVTIAENKFPVNTTMYGGTQHKAELNCVISPTHTTTSLNTARHIDVTYALCVKTLIDTMAPIVMELPVIVSNWQRSVSYEAIRRIGPAPGLSLLPTIPPNASAISRIDSIPRKPTASSTLPISRSQDPYGLGRNPSAGTYSTLPVTTPHGSPAIKADELGYGAGLGFGAKPTHSQSNSITSNTDEYVSRSGTITTPTTTGRRPNSSGGTNRFTITNVVPGEIPQDETPRNRSGSAGGGSPNNRNWLSAEDEKQRLYESARAKVEQVQGGVARVTTPPPQVAISTAKQASKPGSPKNSTWLTAEEEKLRLFHEAQAAVAKTQGYSPTTAVHDLIRSPEMSRTASTSKAKPTSAAALYSEAMSARKELAAERQERQTNTPPRASPRPTNLFLSAEEEKAQLRRYEQAKKAVDRVQNAGYSSEEILVKSMSATRRGDPIAYDSLYPNLDTRGASSSAPAPLNDLPPPFEAPASSMTSSHVAEKERLRRTYEIQDATTTAPQNGPLPPPFTHEPSAVHQAISEKERLRRKFEAQDAEALTSSPYASPPQPPPRSMSSDATSAPAPPPRGLSNVTRASSAAPRTQRPTPAPPSSPGKIMTAAEEKALLKAQYAAEDARAVKSKPQVNGTAGGYARPGSSTTHVPLPDLTPPSPPPLMPRPPVEYIQETQEEDARVSRFALNGMLPSLDDELSNGTPVPPLEITPFTPFSAGFDTGLKIPGPPPPLPPKPEE